MANVIKHKRGSGSDPGASDLVVGEVAIRTDVGKLFTKMDNGSVAEIAGGGSDIAINTLSSSSATGGGSATFNGSAYRFTLSQPPSVSAYQLLVSINGVIQKPVAGTGQPSEGFSVSGNDIILGDAPATGADFFILTFKSLGVSEPADNSVTSAKIADGAIVNADINASAAIAGTKISPTFTSDITINEENPAINFADNGENPDYQIRVDAGKFFINDTTNSAARFTINTDGHIDIAGNVDFGAGIDVTGNITVSGTVDGVDVAALSSTVSGLNNTTINNNADNRVITGSGTANTLNGEANLTFDGNLLATGSSGTPQITVENTSNSAREAAINIKGKHSNGTVRQLMLKYDNNDRFRIATAGSIPIAFETADAERMRIDSAGQVGIGVTPDTWSTGAGITVGTSQGTLWGSGDQINLSGNAYFNSGWKAAASKAGASQIEQALGNIDFKVSGSVTADSAITFTNAMRIDSSGNVGIGLTNPTGMFAVSDGSVTGEINPSGGICYIGTRSNHPVTFLTNASGRMTIDSSGNVGMGTTSPVQQSGIGLHINNGSGQSRIKLTNNNTGSTANDGFDIIQETEGNGNIHFLNHENSIIKFGTNDTERMRVAASGNIGIGSTNPQSMLHIKGNGGVLAVDSYPTLTLETGSADATANKGTGILFLNYNGSGGTFGGSIQCLKENSSNNNESNYMRFSTRVENGSVTERVRITAAGQFRAGPESSSDRTGFAHQLSTESGSSSCLSLQNPNNGDGNQVRLGFFSRNTNNATVEFARIHMEATETQANSSQCGSLIFQTNVAATLAERMRINSLGDLQIGQNANDTRLGIKARSSAVEFITCRNTSDTLKFYVHSSGNTYNTNGNYSQISDQSLKENIVDAKSQWDDIKNIKIRNFNFTEASGMDTHTQIGCVAQEVETVSPKLVTAPREDGIKTVANSVLYMKAVKALQEAIVRIEALETKVAALEAG